MARETKAQREARLKAERQAQMAFARDYTERMMAVLERAVKENFELEVRNSLFVVQDRDDRRSTPFFLNPVYSHSQLNDMDLYSLEVSVELKEEARAEREQKALVRANALAKLTAEEKELLGL